MSLSNLKQNFAIGKLNNILCMAKRVLIGEQVSLSPAEKEKREIIDDIINAKKEWERAFENYQNALDETLIDYYIYNIKACQLKYEHYLKLAKEKGIRVGMEYENYFNRARISESQSKAI